jgi:DNA processing protein
MDASPTTSAARLAIALLKPSEARAIIGQGEEGLIKHLDGLEEEEQAKLEDLQHRLAERGVRLLLLGDEDYPDQLSSIKSPPPFLYYWGNLDLAKERGIGMCGSRNASDRGLEAARVCGEEVAKLGWHVVSGYAKGVDTETHLAALAAGAGTVIVLAEGILNFRRKRVFARVPFDEERVLVLSQFRPEQRWSVGGAMTRNGLISALGDALLVIEAGEGGGTLDAGTRALQAGQQVFTLQFSESATPVGNRRLLEQGARALSGRRALAKQLSDLHARPPARNQMPIPGALSA